MKFRPKLGAGKSNFTNFKNIYNSDFSVYNASHDTVTIAAATLFLEIPGKYFDKPLSDKIRRVDPRTKPIIIHALGCCSKVKIQF